MSKLHLNAIVTQALLDGEFEKAILNGQRKARLAGFDLTENEREAVLAIKSPNLDQFIAQVDGWMESTDRRRKLLTSQASLWRPMAALPVGRRVS
jgi:hypothetical protein